MFNLLAGRDLQTSYGQEQQVALTFPVLTGVDGTMRMSKSTGNYIGVSENPKDMFGKVMSTPDSILPEWLALLSDLPASEVRDLADPKKTNPNGGAIAIGHPIGASGAVIITKALYEAKRVGSKYCLATMCIGGGQGITTIWEMI